jgi:hypothetical protein
MLVHVSVRPQLSITKFSGGFNGIAKFALNLAQHAGPCGIQPFQIAFIDSRK